MPGTLYVVSTPIGNLEDITLRALRILREVSLIAAEDTRRTAKLLSHYSISTPTTSVREHNERRQTSVILERLAKGHSVALVSDAGTPGVSDPGHLVVRAAHEAGHKVVAIPGPSAVLAALVSSPFPSDSFLFAGFAPSKARERRAWLRNLSAESRTVVFFEAPHRIQQTLKDAESILGERPIMLARELTKLHETLVVRPINATAEAVQEPKGEYTVVIGPPENIGHSTEIMPDDNTMYTEFGHLTDIAGLSRRSAVAELAAKYGVAQRTVYAAVERGKKLVS
jgi:16S rRNA (cytidine1402-2'-O)-methyltransferase